MCLIRVAKKRLAGTPGHTHELMMTFFKFVINVCVNVPSVFGGCHHAVTAMTATTPLSTETNDKLYV